MNYKIEYLLNLANNISTIDVSKHNSKTVYLIGRALRKIEPFTKKFEEDRTKALKDEWFVKYSADRENDADSANEKYKTELEALDTEIREMLEVEVDIDFYQVSIDDVSFEGIDIVKFIDLIKE